uniref:RNA-directed DNA polymerase n=1 Tax=Trichogramma kaykai TaxID=54128 RepID=A0ABD2W8I8_9HYME
MNNSVTNSEDEFEKFVRENHLKGTLQGTVSKMSEEALIAEIERQKKRRQEERDEFQRQIKELKESSSQQSNSTNGDQLSSALIALSQAIEAQSANNRQNCSDNVGEVLTFATTQNLIRDFYGTEGPEKANAWRNELGTTRVLYNWSDVLTLSIAKAKMKGAAWKWLLTKGEEIKSLQDFVQHFNKTFTYKRSKSEQLKIMVNRSQGFRENTAEYFIDKVWLCKELKLTVNEIRDEVATGLWSKEFAQHIMSRDYDTTDEILQDLTRIETIAENRKTRISEQRKMGNSTKTSGGNGSSSASSQWRSSSNVNKNTTSSNSTEAEQNTSDFGAARRATEVNTSNEKAKSKVVNNRSLKCYSCNEEGHIARECQNPKREFTCFKCNKPGHVASRCRVNEKNSNSEVNVINVSNTYDSKDKFIRDVKIGDKYFKAQIDTGAGVCTIKSTTVLTSKFQVIDAPTVLEAFGASFVNSPGMIEESIQLDTLAPRKIIFRIVPDTAQHNDIILGRSFTEDPTLTYTRLGSELYFSDVDTEELNSLSSSKARVVKETEVEPNEIRFIDISFESKELKLPVVNVGRSAVCVKPNDQIGNSILSVEQMFKTEMRRDAIHEAEVITDVCVSVEQKNELLKILNKHRVCVAKKLCEIGKADEIQMDIEVDPDAVVQSKPYRLNATDRADLEKCIEDYKKIGIVTETESKYASPAFIVRKKDGTPRMVVDYRRLNKVTKILPYPIPNFDDMIEKLNGAKFFITLDLAWGYLQVPLTERAKEKTAFITETQTGQFERAMFGLANAPRYFAKLMDRVIGTARKKGFVFNFFDDICIYAENWKNLMSHLDEILTRLENAGLTLRLEKCRFGMKMIEYLGYVLGEGIIKPGDRKIVAIEQFPRPKNKREIKQFIGLAGFFRRFVPNFAIQARPLTKLLKNDAIFQWNDEQNLAFTELKSKLSCRPILRLYNPKATRTELHTDASASGLGAVLLQTDQINEPLRLVYAISRCTNEAEAKYHSSRLELLAVAWSLERLRPFLIGIKFYVVTDCQSLIHLNAWKTKNSQVARWMSEIAEYDLEIIHKQGKSMQHVDALSRAPVDCKQIFENEKILNIDIKENEILLFQRSDESVSAIIDLLKKDVNMLSNNEQKLLKDYALRDGILYKKLIRNDAILERFVVPKAMRKSLIIKYHNCKGHVGVNKTADMIEKYYYFPRMRNYIKIHIKNCIECILMKKKAGPGEGELHPIPAGKRPFETVHTDHVGPFPTSARGNKFVLGIIDNLTKFVFIVPVKNCTSQATVKHFEEFVRRFGAPVRVISDRGTAYTGHPFQEFCLKHGIYHVLNSSRHPMANGLIERMNQSLVPLMRISIINGKEKDWDVNIKNIECDLNMTVSAATGKAPFESLYGYLPSYNEGPSRTLKVHNEIYNPPQETQADIREKIKLAQTKYKTYYDKNRYKYVKYQVGDIVFMKRQPNATGESKKLQAVYTDPLVVIAVCPSDVYRVKKLNDCKNKNYETTAHVSQLKVWKGSSMCDDDLECEKNVLSESSSGDETELVPTPKNKISSAVSESNQSKKDKNENHKTIIPMVRTRAKPHYLNDYVQ